MTDYAPLATSLPLVPIGDVRSESWDEVYVVYRILEDLQGGIGKDYLARYSSLTAETEAEISTYVTGGGINGAPFYSDIIVPELDLAAQTAANVIQTANNNFQPDVVSGLKAAINQLPFYSFIKDILKDLVDTLASEHSSIFTPSELNDAVQIADLGSETQVYNSTLDISGGLTFSGQVNPIELGNSSEMTWMGSGGVIDGGDENVSVQTGTLLLANVDLTNIGVPQDSGVIQIDPSILSVATLSGDGALRIGQNSTLSLDGAAGYTGTITFDGGNGFLQLSDVESFQGVIAGFAPGDTIDLADIGIAAAITLDTDNVLTVEESGGGTIALQLDPTQDYSGVSLISFQDDAEGDGTDITVMPLAEISGFQPVTIDAPITDPETHNTTTYSATVIFSATNIQFPAFRGYVDEEPLPATITATFAGGSPDPNGGAVVINDFQTGALFGVSGFSVPVNSSGTGEIVFEPSDLSGSGDYSDETLPLTVSYDGSSTTFDLHVGVNVYAPAIPEVLTDGTQTDEIDFGIVHVGQTASTTVEIANVATGALTDSLISSAGSLGEFTAENGLDDVQSGSQGTVTLSVTGDVAGSALIVDSTPLFNLVSHDGELPDEGFGPFTAPSLDAEVFNYAQPALINATVDTSGNWVPTTSPTAGTFTQTGDNSWTLDFGTLYKAYTNPYLANIVIENTDPVSASAYSDYLEGSLSASGSGLIYDVENTLPVDAAAGGSWELGDFEPDVTNLGTQTVTVVYSPTSVDSAGTTDLPDITLTVTADVVACYASGTCIATTKGDVPIQCLEIGDRVPSQFSGMATVKWLGYRRVGCRRHPRPRNVWPVRVRAGAFGEQQPCRDLLLSPDHAIFVDGVLIPVRCMINGASVVQEEVESVTYWHVELDQHDVILAEGLPCESYLDTGNRFNFENGDSPTALHADFTALRWEVESCAPLVVFGPALDAVRRRLNTQAAVIGRPTPHSSGSRVAA